MQKNSPFLPKQRLVFLCEKGEQLSPTLARAMFTYLDEIGLGRKIEVIALGVRKHDLKKQISPTDILATTKEMTDLVKSELDAQGLRERPLMKVPFFMNPPNTYPENFQKEYSAEKRRAWGEEILEKIRTQNAIEARQIHSIARNKIIPNKLKIQRRIRPRR